jgi:PAS domain S-box-containing protein
MVVEGETSRDATARQRAEEAIREREAQLQTILDSLTEGLVVADLESNLLHWNPAALAMHGFASMEECRRCLPDFADTFELSTPEDGILPLEQWPLARILRGETLNGWEVRVSRPGTDWQRVFSYRGRLARNQDGQPLLAVVAVSDITERRQAEREIQRLASFPHMNPQPVLEMDSDGRITYFNQAALAALGPRGQAADLKNFLPDDLPEIFAQAKLTGEKSFQREVVVNDAVFLENLYFAEPSQAVRLYAVDITERQRAEAALRESEERFRTMANAIPQLAWTATSNGYISWYNQRWYDYTGTTPADMEGWGWQSVHDPKVLPKVLDQWRASLATGRPFDMVFPLRGADGQFREFLTRVMPIKDSGGQVIQWFGTNTDITQRQQAEEALRRSYHRLDLLAETASQLLGSVSPQKVVDAICLKVMEFLHCDAFFNFLQDEQEGRLYLNTYAGIPEEEARRIQWLDYGAAVCGCAAQDGCRIVTEDILNTNDPRTDLVKSYGIQAYACHPLLVEGRVLGTLSFGTRSRSHFTMEELTLMNAVADQVAIAMDRQLAEAALRRLNEELEHRVEERTAELQETVAQLEKEIHERQQAEEQAASRGRLYRLLSRVSEAIVRAHDQEGLFRQACRIMMEEGDFLLCWIGRVDREAGLVRAATQFDLVDDYPQNVTISLADVPEGRGPSGVAVREGRWDVCPDVAADPRMAPWRSQALARGFRSSAAFPLFMGGRVEGVLTLYSGQKDFFNEEEVALLNSLAQDLSFAMESMDREAKRRQAEEEIRRLNEKLEQRVKERTTELEFANRELEAFTYSVSHDLKAPLRAIQGFSRILVAERASGLDKEGLRLLDVIVSNTRIMTRLIDDLLALSRLGRQQIIKSHVNLAVMARQVFKPLQAQEPDRDLRLVVQDLPLAWGEPSLLNQVMMNLLGNAIKYTRPVKTAVIEVAGQTEGRETVYSVKDNGIGFDARYAHKLFGVFQRLHSGTEYEGTGVGLAIVQRIIHRHGGRIWAEGKEGEGATFYFALPQE